MPLDRLATPSRRTAARPLPRDALGQIAKITTLEAFVFVTISRKAIPVLNSASTILVLLTAVTVFAFASRRFVIPYPTLMVLAGAALGWVPGLPRIEFESDTVLLIFLPPLLYAAAWQTSWRDFKANLRPIGMLAVGLVVATTVGVALVTHAMVDAIPWGLAFALGALVAPPDAIAATAVTQQTPLPRRLITIIEGESLVNDATGLVLYRVAVAAALTGEFSPATAAVQFLVSPLGGIAIGLAIGWLTVRLHRRLEDAKLESAVTLLTPFAAYVPAEMLGVSGVLAVVSAGIFVSRCASSIFSPATRLNANSVWDLLVFMLNGLAFSLIGLQIPAALAATSHYSLSETLGLSALVCFTVLALRMLWVFPAAYIPRLMSRALRERDPAPPTNILVVLGWAGMRGVVTVAAALALPEFGADGEHVPYRDILIVVAFAVVLATLVIQGQTLPALIRWLKVEPHEEEELCADARARREILAATISYLDGVSETGDLDRGMIKHFRERFVRLLSTTLPTDEHGDLDLEAAARAQAQTRLHRDVLTVQRQILKHLDKRGEVPLDVLRRIERVLDLEEARIAEITPGRPGANN
jgi:Na+/H+ antiporter